MLTAILQHQDLRYITATHAFFIRRPQPRNELAFEIQPTKQRTTEASAAAARRTKSQRQRMPAVGAETTDRRMGPQAASAVQRHVSLSPVLVRR
jgi:hypothetical protein